MFFFHFIVFFENQFVHISDWLTTHQHGENTVHISVLFFFAPDWVLSAFEYILIFIAEDWCLNVLITLISIFSGFHFYVNREKKIMHIYYAITFVSSEFYQSRQFSIFFLSSNKTKQNEMKRNEMYSISYRVVCW